MNSLSDTLDRDSDIELLLKYNDDWEKLIGYLIGHSDEKDEPIYLLSLLTEIAHDKNTVFWYTSLGSFLSFWLPYLDGARKTALSYLIKAHELDKSDISTLEAILDFGFPPEVILLPKELKFYAKIILNIDPTHSRATSIIGDK